MRICPKCVMDGSAKELVIENGSCNFCKQAQKSLREAEESKKNLLKIIENIKNDGKGKQYDALIGLSGGVDSSTVLHNAVKLGIRPLCYSIDNGYNDPKADENIMRMVETLKVPFYRYTININKFQELQGAFIQAGLINIEIPTDHILFASSYETAAKYNIKWIISGGNVSTESIMPASWSYRANDLVHIKDIYKKMTGKELKNLPMLGLWKWNFYKWIKKIKVFYLLDCLDYHREDSIGTLKKEYGYQPYGDKHEESIFTKWYQNFYLFEKFGIDKRKAHYSSLINSGQMTREEAMRLSQNAPEYPSLGIEAKVLKYPKRHHNYFKQDKWFDLLGILIRRLRKPYRKLMKSGNPTMV